MSDSATDSDTARPSSPSVHLSATAQLKVPPHSIEAEQSVLGGLMLNNDAWLNVSDILTNRDFYRAQHQIIFEAMANLANANEPLDAVTLSEALASRGTARQSRRHQFPGRNRRDDPRREQRARLCADRSRTFDVAPADRGRQQDRRVGVSAAGPAEQRTARHGRIGSVPYPRRSLARRGTRKPWCRCSRAR